VDSEAFIKEMQSCIYDESRVLGATNDTRPQKLSNCISIIQFMVVILVNEFCVSIIDSLHYCGVSEFG